MLVLDPVPAHREVGAGARTGGYCCGGELGECACGGGGLCGCKLQLSAVGRDGTHDDDKSALTAGDAELDQGARAAPGGRADV
jgi:hypothetical protein